MKNSGTWYCLVLLWWLLMFSASQAQTTDHVQTAGPVSLVLEIPGVVLSGVPFSVTARVVDDADRVSLNHGDAFVLLGQRAEFIDGEAVLSGLVVGAAGVAALQASSGALHATVSVRVLPGWVSILPPLMAIVLALVFQEVLMALCIGIWCGLLIFYDFNPLVASLRLVDTAIVESMGDPGNTMILLFTLILGGMVGIMVRSGAMEGVVRVVSRLAGTPVRVQVATWILGICIFFDDYANTLIVGNSMRSLTDRMRISREKLAFIVDSTAAPVATLALVSTWIGYELGVLNSAFQSVGREADYLVFLQSIPYSFYSIFTVLFVLMIAWSGRDFGPMLTAERRARRTGKLIRDGSRPLSDPSLVEASLPVETPRRWINAALPVVVVVVGTFIGLYYDGWDKLGSVEAPTLLAAIREADAFRCFMWATCLGALLAGVLVVSQGILSVADTFDAWVRGVRAMVLACAVLVLAWALGDVCELVHTADYVVAHTRDVVSPQWLPVLTFVLAAVISFSTGTSYGTMAILFPLLVPLAFSVTAGLDPSLADAVLYGTIGAVLSGATFGDHCSPISDTTIMSSMGASCDHVDHVKTQLPYAGVVGLVSIAAGYIPAGFGVHPLWGLSIGILLLLGIIRIFGRRADEEIALP